MRFVYLDTNIFFYLTDIQSSFYQRCKRFIKYCRDNNIFVVTAVETFQEIIHHAQGTKQLKKGIKIAEESLRLANQILIIDEAAINDFLQLVKKYPTVPSRDILHLAVGLRNRVDLIITYDKHFKKFKEIQAMTPTEFLARY